MTQTDDGLIPMDEEPELINDHDALDETENGDEDTDEDKETGDTEPDTPQ